MGFISKILNGIGVNDDDYEDDFYDDEDDYEEDVPKKGFFSRGHAEDDEDDFDDRPAKPKASKPQNKITPIRQTKRQANGMEVCVIKPNTVEDAREITETLLTNRTVVLNLEGLDVDIAQRIIDFTSGSCFAINGNLQKISAYIFIVTPASVDISGDFQDILNGAIGGMGLNPLNTGI